MNRPAFGWLLLGLAAACGAPPEDLPGSESEAATVSYRLEGQIVSTSGVLPGAYVIALGPLGQRLGRATTGADGRYVLTVAALPDRVAVKAYAAVPRFVPGSALRTIGTRRYRLDLNVGPPPGADTTAENLIYLVADGANPVLVPQMAWGSGGGIGSPIDEMADLLVGPRVRALVTLLPRRTSIPDLENAVTRVSTPAGDYLEARFSADLNGYNYGAAYSALMIHQIVNTISFAEGSRLPVRIRVACPSCPGGYQDLRDGHVGPTGPGNSYPPDGPGPGQVYSDLAGHRYARHVAMGKGLGVVGGYPDGSFRPDAGVTRVQVATMLVRALGLATPAPATPSFRDVRTTDWYYRVVEAVRAAGIMSGYGDGSFRPDGPVTRAELASFVVNAARWPLAQPAAPAFSDVAPSYWAYRKIETAFGWCHAAESRSWSTPTRFEPAAAATRAEAAAAVMRMTSCFTGDEVR